MQHFTQAIDTNNSALKSLCAAPLPLAGTTWVVTMDPPDNNIVFTWVFNNDGTVTDINWAGQKQSIPYTQSSPGTFTVGPYSGSYANGSGAGTLVLQSTRMNFTMQEQKSPGLAGTKWQVAMASPYNYIVFTWEFQTNNVVNMINYAGQKSVLQYTESSPGTFSIELGSGSSYSGKFANGAGSGQLIQPSPFQNMAFSMKQLS